MRGKWPGWWERLPEPQSELPELRAGDAFTVFGASYFLRSRHHRPEGNGQRISVHGDVVKTNLPEAPPCAVHRARSPAFAVAA